ncbi:hypothetical protein KDX38_17290 [Pseudomonas sp. CDFA 602]|uniref:hypothetical protein n=1 Tax=Pseudomonas californiensis TaxID=2829823 RepID=UPI001E345C9C|nr:hypothetical protein [Pseudomonas californiensis]MCD5995443.1 hypothetical protein [Pseudomonas californiensis]MCD6000961.1 hypothetical protein [Pseudomonas californiensis]
MNKTAIPMDVLHGNDKPSSVDGVFVQHLQAFETQARFARESFLVMMANTEVEAATLRERQSSGR